MQVLFLPGAAGAPEFWHPLGALLPSAWEKTYLSWPGLGDQPHDPSINGFDDMVRMAAAKLEESTVVIAQSMGGIVGVRLAVDYPEKIGRLVLVATSGGLDVSGLGGAEWRSAYLSGFPRAQKWITTSRPDQSSLFARIACPTLLIWGDKDPISPPPVGAALAERIPCASLHIISGGDHSLGKEKAQDIEPLITRWIAR